MTSVDFRAIFRWAPVVITTLIAVLQAKISLSSNQTDLFNTQFKKKKVKKDNAVFRSAHLRLFFTTALDLSYALFKTRGT